MLDLTNEQKHFLRVVATEVNKRFKITDIDMSEIGRLKFKDLKELRVAAYEFHMQVEILPNEWKVRFF